MPYFLILVMLQMPEAWHQASDCSVTMNKDHKTKVLSEILGDAISFYSHDCSFLFLE